MRAVMHTRQGEPAQVLTLRERPDRSRPGAGEVLVRMLVRPVHPGDLAGVEARAGPTERQPEARIPGVEGMGVVESAGADVHPLRPGQRVAVFPAPGTWAESVVVAADWAVPVADEVSDETAALMLVNPLTLLMLYRALESALRGQKGSVVQTAAGSSVGRLVSAAAVRHDLPLINLVRSQTGAQRVRTRYPTLPVVPTCDDDWREQEERAQDVGFAWDLARNTPDLLEVAAGYDLAEFKTAIQHARRPAKSGTVLLTTPGATDSGLGAAR
ncbi:alcohol dehydrogenase catalytic domain-containing protein [Streptomyces sp. 378]|uniref:alcohol dehydrogenase catalytic domain-containing protein n=1 Tax=Streptomyces sp. 378 TaxID=3049412 RepID=UPI0024C42A1C|nr:alcohol dehydrogenase catalytic domain-containing protein [Streptomyces sp. 378]MDK1348717.1 alcohol dehydrogenase catalytic domain-containing protein [Streptomyces sp. 378]